MPPAPPIVTGLSPKEGVPGTKVTIRGENLGNTAPDLVGLTICGVDCLLSAEWKSPNKIIARTGAAKGKGDILVTTRYGGQGTSTVQFKAYYETIGPLKESAVWIEESPMQSLAWGRRSLAPSAYTQDDPLGLSIEGNDKKFPEDLREIFPDGSGDLSQESFTPAWFLLEHHHGTSFDDLKAGLSYLRRKVESQKEGQLSFLKSNAGSVIDQLDTLMSIKEKFGADVKAVGKEPVKELDKAIQESLVTSHALFNDVLARREKADSTRAALAALSRHRFLFCLPNAVERSAARNEFDIVCNDYARAKNLFGKSEVEIFKKVLEEVDQRVLNIRRALHKKICEMPQGVEQQKRLVKALINLEGQQASSSVAAQLKIDDPAWDAIEARGKYLERTFKDTYEAYLAKESPGSATKARGDPNQAPNRLLFCEEMTEIAAGQFPDLWRIGQAYFTGELRGYGEPKPGNFKLMILSAIEQFCAYLKAALLPASSQRGYSGVEIQPWPNSASANNQFAQWIPHCLRFVRISYSTLIRLDLPNEALDIVLKLINELRLHCLTTILKRTNEKVRHLGEQETWEIMVAEFPGATQLPSKLEEILTEALDDAQAICLAPEAREGALLDPHSDGHREVSKRLLDILNSFCDVVETLAKQRPDDEASQNAISQLIGFPAEMAAYTSVGGSPDKNWGALISWEQRVLCCLSNCAFCYRIVFPRLETLLGRYSVIGVHLTIDTARTTINQLFQNLLEAYVEQKSDPLVGTIEPSMYIGRFHWDGVDTTEKLSPYAHECCDNLVGVYAEIFSISPFLLRPVLEPIVQTVAEELARLMTCVQRFSEAGALQASVDIRLIQDAVRVYSNSTAKSHFGEALEWIEGRQPLTSDGRRRAEYILDEIKEKMKLQIMCLQVTNP